MRGILKLAAFVLVWAGFGAASAAQQDVQDRISAAELEQVLRDAGLEPTMLKDGATGAPVATVVFRDEDNLDSFGRPQQTVFVVRAMDCGGVPMKCGQLVLFANFDLSRDVTEQDFRVVNEFNDTSVHGRAFVLENKRQIGVDFRIDMIGGVTGDHIDGRIERWPGVIREFRQRMQNANSGS